MAHFKTTDFLKESYIRTLCEIARERKEMIVGKFQDGTRIKLRPLIVLDDIPQKITKKTIDNVIDATHKFLKKNRGSPPRVVDSKGKEHSVISLFRDSRFLPKTTIKADPNLTGKARQQRQEIGLVSSINEMTLDGPVRIPDLGYGIVRAEQAPDIGPHGKENLVDVILYLQNGARVNVSCKQTNAADLGGGGMAGLKKLVPHLIDKLYKRVVKDLTDAGFVEGVTYKSLSVPTYVYEIPQGEMTKIFRGHNDIGGEIDYFYIGPPEVSRDSNGRFNGKFISVKDFARKKKFYFRLRLRDIIQGQVTIDYKKKTREGYPALFVTGPARSNAARFVIDDMPPISSVKKRL